MITKTKLDKLVEKYETVNFINNDPIQFCHRYKQKEEIELAGFIASLFAYGNRKIFGVFGQKRDTGDRNFLQQPFGIKTAVYK